MKIEIERTYSEYRGFGWRWRLVTKHHHPVALGPQLYARKGDAIRAAKRFIALLAEDVKIALNKE